MEAVLRCVLSALFIVQTSGFGYHEDLLYLGTRRVEVFNDLDFAAALQDDSIDRIVLMRDVKLGAEWDNQNIFPLHIRRNVTIKSSLQAAAFASLDFRYLTGKLFLEPGVWLSIFRLRLRGLTASHAPSFPFVATSPGSHVLFQDCLLHRTSCVPMELVYDSIKSRPPSAAGSGAANIAGSVAGAGIAAGAPMDAAIGCGLEPGPGPAPPPFTPVFLARDIELLRRHCFTTVAGGRECRPSALQLRDYSYETRRRSSGAAGTGGFVLHARNTTLVCDYPVSEKCMRDKGPEFCVTRELSRRQRQETWRRGAVRAALAAAGTVAALAVGSWLLRRQAAVVDAAPPPTATAAAAAASGPAIAPAAAAAAAAPQWLAEVPTEVEAKAAAAGVPCRRPLVRMPSGQSATSLAAEADVTPTLSRASTRNLDQGPGTGPSSGTVGAPGSTPSSGPAPSAGASGAAARAGPSPSCSAPGGEERPLPRETSAGGGEVLAAGEGGTAGSPGLGRAVDRPAAAAAPPPEQVLDCLGRLLGTCEVVRSSAEDSGASSSVIRAAAETQERIRHLQQTIHGAASDAAAAATAAGGGSVYDHLEVTELLGSGTFGKVFKGFWHGTLVAVKLMVFPAALAGRGQLESMAAMEAAISSSLSHPNIVQTYTWLVTPLLDASPLQSATAAAAAAAAAAPFHDGPKQQQPSPPPELPRPTGAPVVLASQQPRPAQTHHDENRWPHAHAQDQDQDPHRRQAHEAAAAQPPSPPRDPKQPAGDQRRLSADAAGSGPAPPARQQQLAEQCSPPPARPGRRQSGGAGPLVASAGAGVLQEGFELCLILELCDGGSLRDLLGRGGFRRAADHGSVCLGELLDVATDVARAMAYLHAKSIVHSDLKSRNVLLKSVSGNPAALGRRCGVVAKVSDFGLSFRIDNDATHVSNVYQGTAAFMAPELLLYGRISKASDVYSFGILLWEMYTCGEAFRKVPKALLAAKVVEGLRPDFPPETPPPYSRLAQQCWAEDPLARPSFDQVVRELNCMRAALHGEPPPPPAQSLGSVTAQLRRNSTGHRGGQPPTRTAQPLTLQPPPPPPQQQQQQQQPRLHCPQQQQALPGAPPPDAVGEMDTGSGGGAGCFRFRQPRPLPLLTEALLASKRRIADAAWAAAAPGAGDDGIHGGSGSGGGAAPPPGSGSLSVLQLQRLIEGNLLIVGGSDGGSTMAGLS